MSPPTSTDSPPSDLPPYSAVSSDPPPPPAATAAGEVPPPLSPPPTRSAPRSNRPTPPTINLLLLGSPNTGKSTFVSRLPYVRDGALQYPKTTSSLPSLSSQQGVTPNPSIFNVSLFARPYEIALYRSVSTLFIDPFPDKIDALVLCFAVDDRLSLINARRYWRRVFAERYDDVPMMLLGLKRDARHGGKQTIVTSTNTGGDEGMGNKEEYICVMPEEGLEAAKELQCDRYAECSAWTGELMFEALEDVTRMAAGTTTDSGGYSQEGGCVVN